MAESRVEYQEGIERAGEALMAELTDGETRYAELEDADRVTLLRMAVLQERTAELLEVIRSRDSLMDDFYRVPGQAKRIENLLKVASDADRIATRNHPADATFWGESHLRQFEVLACDARDAADAATLTLLRRV